LRKTHEVQHRSAFAFKMRGHADQCADRHHTGAAHTRHQDVVGRIVERHLRLDQRVDARRQRSRIEYGAGRLFHACAFQCHEARTEAVHARKVLVA